MIGTYRLLKPMNTEIVVIFIAEALEFDLAIKLLLTKITNTIVFRLLRLGLHYCRSLILINMTVPRPKTIWISKIFI